MNIIDFDSNGTDFDLMLNQVPKATILLSEDGAKTISDSVRNFLQESSYPDDIIEIKNDDDKLGIIVDVWDKDQIAMIDTCCFWFDDFIKE